MLLLSLSAALASDPYQPRDGDVLLQTSRSPQSQLIQLATGSPYSHTGLVLLVDGAPWVYEAVQPVQAVPLDAWVERGEGGRFTALRLVDPAPLTDDGVAALRGVMEGFLGLDYDPWFAWSDDRIYCSELVWKAYARGLGVELGALERLGDFDLSHPAVAAEVGRRYGPDVPVDEPVAPPSLLAVSDRLRVVYSNYP